MANLIFNQVPTEFRIIHNATKKLGKAERWITEDASRLSFHALRSQGALHCLRTNISLGIQRATSGLPHLAG